MFPDPNDQRLTSEDALALVINTFAIGFFVAFVLWLALDWTEVEKITTMGGFFNEVLIGILNAIPGGILALISIWIYHRYLKV